MHRSQTVVHGGLTSAKSLEVRDLGLPNTLVDDRLRIFFVDLDRLDVWSSVILGLGEPVSPFINLWERGSSLPDRTLQPSSYSVICANNWLLCPTGLPSEHLLHNQPVPSLLPRKMWREAWVLCPSLAVLDARAFNMIQNKWLPISRFCCSLVCRGNYWRSSVAIGRGISRVVLVGPAPD